MNLSEYQKQQKHLLAVDCIIFGYEEGELKLLLFKRKIEPEKNQWSLIGGWVNDEERLEEAAIRVLESFTSLKDIYMEQVKVYSDPKRDSGGRVVSVTFFALITLTPNEKSKVEEAGAKWFLINDKPDLIFDHDEMVRNALEKLRFMANNDLIVKSLLPEKFTITELRNLYDALFQRTYDAGNFRKKILSMNILKKLPEKDKDNSKKGAFLYCFRDDDESKSMKRIAY